MDTLSQDAKHKVHTVCIKEYEKIDTFVVSNFHLFLEFIWKGLGEYDVSLILRNIDQSTEMTNGIRLIYNLMNNLVIL